MRKPKRVSSMVSFLSDSPEMTAKEQPSSLSEDLVDFELTLAGTVQGKANNERSAATMTECAYRTSHLLVDRVQTNDHAIASWSVKALARVFR